MSSFSIDAHAYDRVLRIFHLKKKLHLDTADEPDNIDGKINMSARSVWILIF